MVSVLLQVDHGLKSSVFPGGFGPLGTCCDSAILGNCSETNRRRLVSLQLTQPRVSGVSWTLDETGHQLPQLDLPALCLPATH
jgi:hypothetical protein